MKRIPLAILLTMFTATVAHAQAERPRAAIDPAGCVTADCHANIKSSAVLHGPVASDACEACHELTDAAAHTYRMIREKTEMCTYCHEFDVSAMPVLHAPVTKGECLGCHDPHGGVDQTITREKSMSALCARCHDKASLEHKFLHTPVSNGQCDSCHPPHAAMFPKLLDAVGSDLCLACHDDFDNRLAAARFRHKALEDGCEKCHDAHGSDEPMQVLEPTLALCEGCHEPVKDTVMAAEFKHSVVTSDRACLTCHTPHGGNTVGLMLDQPVKLCMTCHKDPIKVDSKRTVPAVAELSDGAMHLHGAIKDGQCSGCHLAHGADQPNLLAKVYQQTIYQPFAVERYELCFGCHDQRLVLDAKTATTTAFRNGEQNLHSVHVKEGQLGRACAMCHTTHASINDRNIRPTTVFNLWNMPIRFTKTATGGSCRPGCHVEWEYDREHPVTAPTTAPARPLESPARPPQAAPMIVSIDATDLDGQKVHAPDPNMPSVALILGPEQARDGKLVKAIDKGLDDIDRVNLFAIISGDAGAEPLPELPWRTVADPDCGIASSLDVHGWPTALVFQSDGLQIARIGGAAESLALKLAPYIELAAKTVDRAAIESQLSDPGLITEGNTAPQSRTLRLAQQLLNDGKPAEAYDAIEPALKDSPDTVAPRVLAVRALCALGRARDADAILSKLDAAALPKGMHQVLEARAALSLQRYSETKRLLQLALDAAPDLAEAHFLLGTVYEAESDFKSAAAEYRAAGGWKEPAWEQ